MVTPKPAFGRNESYALPIYTPSNSEIEAIIAQIELIIGKEVTLEKCLTFCPENCCHINVNISVVGCINLLI